jgi:sec-independent protein translocase protein TatC
MSFFDHLEELRRRILRSLVFFGIAAAGCLYFAADLFRLASRPITADPSVVMAVFRPQDTFNLHIKVSLVAALFLSAPYILAQAWKFISPGLHSHEKRYAAPFVLSASTLFLIGGVFAYFVAFPMTLRFLLELTADSDLTPLIGAVDYFDLFLSVTLIMGIVFQIPSLAFVLSRIGLVDARFLLRNARYALLICLILAAVVTPPDAISMMVIAVPMMALYGVGIAVAWLAGRPRTARPNGRD